MFSTKKFTELAVLGPIDGTEIFSGVSQGGVSSQVALDNLFGSTNFDFSGGVIDTIQDITTASSPTFQDLNLETTTVPSEYIFDYKVAPTFTPYCVGTNSVNAFDDSLALREAVLLDYQVLDSAPTTFSAGLDFLIAENQFLQRYMRFNGLTQKVEMNRTVKNLVGYQSYSEQVIVTASQNVDDTIIGRTVISESASAIVLTIPLNAAFSINTEFEVIRTDTGALSVTAAAGVSINGSDGATFSLPDQWDRAVFRELKENDWTAVEYSSTVGTITNQEVYDNSPSGIVSLAAGKPAGYLSTVAGFLLPQMTEAQFDAIASPDNGLAAWASDTDRVRINKGTPGSPVYDDLAYLTDIAAISEDVVYGESFFQGNATETVIVTQGVPVKVNATYSSGDLQGFVQAAGTLTYQLPVVRTMAINASLTASMNLVDAEISVTIFHNGSAIAKSTQSPSMDGTTPSYESISVTALVSLSQTDTIEIFVQNDSGTDNITVKDLNLKAHSIGGADSGTSGGDLQDAYDSGDGVIIEDSGKPFKLEATVKTTIPTLVLDQDAIPSINSEAISTISSVSKNTSGTEIEYSHYDVTPSVTTPGAECGNFSLYGIRNGTDTLAIRYRGDNDVIILNRNVSLSNRNLTGINTFTQNLQSSTFNDGQGNGAFTIKTPGNSLAYTLSYTNEDANYSIPLTMTPAKAGVNFTLGTVLTPLTTYGGGYQTVWATLDGTNVVSAGQFQIGQTVEMDITGTVSVLVPGPNADGGSSFKLNFGNAFTVISNSIPLGNSSTRVRNWQLKIKVTRVSSTEITASASGYYFDNSQVCQHIAFPDLMNNLTYAYDQGLSYDFTLQYQNSNSYNTALVFIAQNLNIKQYS
jgi:hypothetical protein